MITKLSHCCVFVTGQNRARDFYGNKLGFEVRSDVPVGDKGNWLIVALKNQKEIEITPSQSIPD